MEKFDQKIKNKISELSYNQIPDKNLMAKMFDKLEKNQAQNVPVIDILPEKRIRRPLISLYLRVAAAVAILFTLGFSLNQLNEVDLYVSKGNMLLHHLPDGSVVQLNADSRIDYNKMSWMFTRNIMLEGEAFFEVEEGKKFTVSSELGNTRVLGTSFNIYARGEDYKVECITGRVKVNYKGGITEAILSPGKGILYAGSTQGEVYEITNKNHMDWRDGEFNYNNESLKKVIDELSRQYNIEVRLDKKYYHNKYTGYFNDKNLETALKLICDPLGLNYTIKDDYVVIE